MILILITADEMLSYLQLKIDCFNFNDAIYLFEQFFFEKTTKHIGN